MMKERSFSEYEIVKKLGRGAQGTVYKAIKNGKIFALKVVRLPDDPKRFNAVINEIKVLEQVTKNGCHPNIICYYDHYYDEATVSLLIEMEYIDGYTLTEYIAKIKSDPKKSPFLIRYLLLILKDLVTGLEYVHSKNLLHNDIKPDNIMIDKFLTPKIIDFGIGCIANTTCSFGQCKYICCGGGIMGTPLYTPPEAYFSEGMRYPQSDIWSLGVSLYYIATGRFPFNYTDKSTLRDVIQGVVYEPVQVMIVDPKTSDEQILTNIVGFMLEKDPSKRNTAAEMVTMINGIIK